MSDEKRQTRLLPFRRRRFGALDARRGYGAAADDFEADAELTALLRAWEAPPPSASARERLLAEFRAAAPRAPFWRRALTSEIRVPLPVAACAALALLVSLYALAARTRTHGAQPAPSARVEAPVRVVEVPVIQERVVTRTVYVEKKGPAAVRGLPAPPPGREALAAVPDPGDAEPPKRSEPALSTQSPAGYFTRVDMEDFQPAEDVKLRIVKRGSVDEK